MRYGRFISVCLVAALAVSTVVVVEPDAEGSPFPYNFDKTIHIVHPDWTPATGIWYSALSGDNITVTISNFSGYSGKDLRMMTGFSGNYYEKDDMLDDSLQMDVPITSNTPITVWFTLAKTFEFKLYFYFSDYTSYGAFDVYVTRAPTSYSIYWEYIEEVRVMTSEMNDTVTLLRNETQHLANLTHPLFNTTTDLLDNVTLLWQNVSALLSDVDTLRQWRSAVTSDLAGIGAELDHLDSSMAALEASHSGLAAQLATLLASYDALNATLTAVAADVDALKASGLDLGWVEQNLTDIRSQLAAMSSLEDDIAALEASVARAAQDISNLTAQLAAVEASVPDAYDDTALRERLAQLETLNGVLQDRVDDLEKEQQDQRDVKSPDAALIYAAFVVGMLGLVVGVAALLYKKR